MNFTQRFSFFDLFYTAVASGFFVTGDIYYAAGAFIVGAIASVWIMPYRPRYMVVHSEDELMYIQRHVTLSNAQTEADDTDSKCARIIDLDTGKVL